MRRSVRPDALLVAFALTLLISALARWFVTQLPAIERSNPRSFREAVDRALANGQTDLATRIADRAARRLRFDPDAFVTLAGLRHLRGDDEGARRALDEAFAIRAEPVSYKPTVMPFYHAEGRTLAALLPETSPGRALTHAELARPDIPRPAYAAPAGDEALFRLYAEAGQWHRALALRAPTRAEIDALSPDSLDDLVRCAEAVGSWDLVRTAASALLRASDGPDRAARAHYALGHAAMAQSKFADAVGSLRAADAAGHPDAPYLLGCALDLLGARADAHRAWRRTAIDSPWRPIALALALDRMGPGHAQHGAVARELSDWCTRPLTLAPDARPTTFNDAGARLTGMLLTRFATGSFPLLARWRVAASVKHAAVDADWAEPTLRVGPYALSVKWVTNELLGSAGLPYGIFSPPEERETHGEHEFVSPPDASPFLRVTRLDDSRDTPIVRVGVPVAVGLHPVWVVCGRHRVSGGEARFGWQFLDDGLLRVQTHDNVPASPNGSDWAWSGNWATPQYQWTAVRLMLGLYAGQGPADFDSLALFGLDLPELEGP